MNLRIKLETPLLSNAAFSVSSGITPILCNKRPASLMGITNLLEVSI